MKGQNIRVAKFSEMQEAARLDAEYAAHPLSEWLDGIVDRPNVTTLSAVTTRVSSGHTPYLHDVDIGDVGFVTVECVGPLRFHAEKLKRVTSEQYENEFTRRPIKAGTVICTIKRRICQAFPWLEEPEAPLAYNQDVALLNPVEGINPAYLATYLSSRIGQSFADRQKTEQMNPYISLENLRTLPVYRAGDELQTAIEAAIRRSQTISDSGLRSLAHAEALLVGALGLAAWSPAEPLTYLASSKKASATGRLDSEFFAPRIQDLTSRLGHQGLTIGKVAPARHDRFDPALPGEFNYIEIGGLGGDGTTSSTRLERSEAPSRATWHVRSGDVITSTVRPIRRLSALIEADQDGHVASSGFVVLNPEHVEPEVLLTYLRLPIVCELMNLHTSSSMYPAISETDLLALPFVKPDKATAAAICSAVVQARAARQNALDVLDRAKRAVEIAIEQDEAAAMLFIQKAGA